MADAAGPQQDEERDCQGQRQRSGLQDAIKRCRQQVEMRGVVDEMRDLRDQHGRRDRADESRRGPGDREQDDHGEREIRAAQIAQHVLVIRSVDRDPVHTESREVVVEGARGELLLDSG